MISNTGGGKRLQGKRVAVLMTDGVEEVEYTEPRGYLEARGAEVTLVSPKAAKEEIQAFNQLTPASTFKVERNVHDVSQADFRYAAIARRRSKSRSAAPERAFD